MPLGEYVYLLGSTCTFGGIRVPFGEYVYLWGRCDGKVAALGTTSGVVGVDCHWCTYGYRGTDRSVRGSVFGVDGVLAEV